jgi:hypothetical protein
MWSRAMETGHQLGVIEGSHTFGIQPLDQRSGRITRWRRVKHGAGRAPSVENDVG